MESLLMMFADLDHEFDDDEAIKELLTNKEQQISFSSLVWLDFSSVVSVTWETINIKDVLYLGIRLAVFLIRKFIPKLRCT